MTVSQALLLRPLLRGPQSLKRCLFPSSSTAASLLNNNNKDGIHSKNHPSSSSSSLQQQYHRSLSTRPSTDSFLSASSALYVESMLEQYEADPSSVPDSWRAYFESTNNSSESSLSFNQPTVLVNHKPSSPHASHINPAALPSDSLGVAHLIRAYQVNGHRSANLDPLGMHTNESFPSRPGNARSKDDLDTESHLAKTLTVGFHGFDPEVDMDRELNFKGVHTGGNKGFLEDLTSMPGKVTLRKVVERLQQTYCGTIGVEYMHIGSVEQCNWIRERVEHPSFLECDVEKKIHLFERLCFADTFETFLANKFNTTKRFGLDGGEAIIPALKDAIDRASELGAHSFIIGMPHRGRLNVLANVMRKPMTTIFSEFQGTHYDVEKFIKMNEEWGSSGDVKYHLGSSMDRTYPDGRKIHLTHLECVNPVVLGKTRAKQFYCGDTDEDMRNVVPILLHGDAAFAGQGVVYETMQLMGVDDFKVGGTIHVIVNNQIGFTTNPINSRSTPYSSDLGKAFNSPIFHCNGDDPVAVSRCLETAIEWRHAWGTDVIIDMICYRRNGHNELDQPMFTQPKLYKAITRHSSTLDIYEKRLIDEGTMSKEEAQEIRDFTLQSYENDLIASKTYVPKPADWLSSNWAGFKGPGQHSRIRPTGVEIDTLRYIGKKAGEVPDGFKIHRQMNKIFKARQTMAEKGTEIDWGLAEAMAFGSLLIEGNHVRLTGQDVQRGTFSHRHAVVKDQDTEEEYTPLNSLARMVSMSAPLEERRLPDTQAKLTVRNSILSEFAVLGFEHGYSLENPNALILWEAQFGDFVNGAQVMLDQFIAAGEDKWHRQSGLVMLLPHGYDGQGAEHSSCRVERYLQMMEEDPHHIPTMGKDERTQIQKSNWQIVNCSTPANYFHCLRRQIHRDFRKPLIVVAPKNLLRNKRCVSTLDDMGPGTIFHRAFDEADEKISSNPGNVKTLVFCTGQIYYELITEREKQERDDVAIVRLEQIAPFAFDKVAQYCSKYDNAEVVWAQQEPKNMGAYSYISPRLMTATRELNNNEKRARYVGRMVSSAPATGMSKIHTKEYNDILNGVFGKVA
eukprot:scaffold89173_cov65-Cyclotella_meneghiniana.AAC.1